MPKFYQPAGPLTCTASEYHADYTRDCHSSLELFRRAVEKYAAIRVHRTMDPDPPTPAMVFGSMFHSFMLEPQAFEMTYVISPKFDLRTKAGKSGAEAWEQENQGKTPITQETLDTIKNMACGLMRCHDARKAISATGMAEEAIGWTDESTGLGMRARLDKILATGLIVDLKTTDDISPSGFSRTVANYGYYRQAALYMAGARLALDADGPFMFIAVSKEAPHETACHVLDDEAIRLGDYENITAISELSSRYASGDWDGQHGKTINLLTLPRWVFSK